ncbi:Sister chromatid cohesion protein pds5 [Lasiodiplodia hormozganensis]|uniref:Sister chromatid cohesion protein pds5 n=1 Tax=Lasiodiplodia hormozganensis TaxID=869390 RepID=A0AA39XPW7_9PEZI|nr:Sister chromatid cohesion protein pds5 [Lasiodiplodia hormozganensis]
MPGTRSRASAVTQIHDDADEQQEASTGLAFNQPLTWRAGKPIPVAELLRRLQALSQELRGLDQEEADRGALMPVAKELASQNLLSHKDRGVRAWTGCCIVDMFRLCAPDAPYTASQLKDIFMLFINTIFRALSDPSDPYNSQHLYVLKSLAEVKSVVLLTDIPSSSTLMTALFTICFDVLSGPSKAESGEELSKNVEHHMTAVLATLVEESQGLPPEVVDVILAQFLRADPRSITGNGAKGKKGSQVDERQSTLLLKEAPPAYNMAKNICNACADKMARLISQYFSSVIVDATTAAVGPLHKSGKHRGRTESSIGDEPDDDRPRHVTEEDLQESRKAHRLLRELWRSAPMVLQDIVLQLEAELGAEDVQLRNLATETLGDMVAGIGAAGPPPPPSYNPSAYPPQSLASPSERLQTYNFLTTPTSPHSFSSRYHQVYESFLSRRNDKSPVIRSAWVTSIGRILATNAGGVGLDVEDEQRLLKYLGDMLVDGDERVRLAAIKTVERFEFDDILSKLGSRGGISEPGSILSNLADRVRDRKPAVRTEATNLLGKVWGVAAGVIAEGSERATQLLGPIPSRILDAFYLNDQDVNVLIDHVLFEQLLPLGYPALKNKSRGQDSQANGRTEHTEADSDKLRVERILILIRDLVQRSKVVLFAKQGNQVMLAKYMEALLKKCEDYNGGVMEKGEKETKLHLGKLIDYHAKTLPESSRASEDLWKFAKMHDRRAYQLIRFCIAPDSDYRKVYKAIKEFTKRMDDATGSTATMLDTLIPLIYRASVLLYNKSHVPAIIEFSRTDEKGLGSTAHEVLKEISSRNPDVFRGYVQEMCKALENEAPTAKKPNGPGAVDDLKACAGFAKRFPKDVPTERKFIQSMINFAEYGTPPKAAKYGVQIILTSTDKKEMHARDLLRKSTKGFEYGKGNYLARLAAMSQLMLLGGKTIEDEIDPVIDICINQVLLTNPAPVDPADNPPWKDEPSEDCTAKMWALKVLVNRLRGLAGNDSIKETSTPVFQLLRTLVTNDGELSKKVESPAAQKTRLRLLAAQLLLKLCHERRFDVLLSGQAFNELAVVAQDPNPNVREGFVKKLMKYLGQDKLPRRFYAPVFLLAFEPEPRLKDGATTWIKARQSAFSKTKDPVFENSFARFLSLLAHHPDYSAEPDNLRDFVQYVMFFLKTVANADNISLIYHVAQRVKSVEDAIEPAKSENLYVLSDLAQGVIQRFQTLHGWSIQAFSKKARMPADVFANLPGHEVAQEIADKQYVPEELVDELDDLVKASMRTKKRKTDSSGDAAREKKRARASLASTRGLPVRKAPKLGKTKKAKKARKGEDVPASERRRSGRVVGDRSYAELSSDDEENADEDEVSDEEEGSEGEGDEDVEMVDQPSEGEEEVADEEAEDEDDEGQNGATGDQEEEEDEEEVEEEQPPPKATPRRARGASRKSAAAETPKGGGGGSAVKSAKGKDKEKGKKSKKADEVVATTPRASRRGGKAAADDKPNGEATPAKGDSAEGGRRSTRRSGRS